MDSCLVTGVERQDRGPDDLLVGESVPGILDIDHRRDQVFAPGLSSHIHDTLEIGDEVFCGRLGSFSLGVGHVLVEHLDDGVAPIQDLSMVPGRETHQLGDHRHRDRRGQVLDDVECARLDGLVDDPGGSLLQPRPERL